MSNVVNNAFFGRRTIYASYDVIDENNVIAEVNKALSLHVKNLLQEEYLYWYRRGLQPILERTKEVRPEINNKIVVNNAEQVCAFKNGYFMQHPAYYVSRRKDEQITESVRQLNEYLYVSGKQLADAKVVDWFHTVGLGVVYVEPNRDEDISSPYVAYAIDPRSAFVVYSLAPGNKPIMGVNMVAVGDTLKIDVYTRDSVYRLLGGTTGKLMTESPDYIAMAYSIEAIEPNVIGEIPIIEYQYNENRMSAFEPAMSIMDAINNAESNRMDGIEQAVQQLCVAYNCQFEEGTTANKIRQAGMIVLKSVGENKADFKILDSVLDQNATQTTVDNLYEQMLYKCSMPCTTKGGSSTSDTGAAVYLRDGFAMADTAARNTQDLFEESNRRFDKVVLAILRLKNGYAPRLEDFELKIERNSTSNLLVKAQAALNMKELGLAPEIALERSGLSNDPLNDIELSKDYIAAAWNNNNAETMRENTDVVVDANA